MAHGAALRVLSKHPYIADQISANYRHAELTPRQRAMLDFAVKVTLASSAIEPAEFEALRGHGFSDSDITPTSLREVEAEAVALVCLEALGLPGAEHCRGYIQHWNERRGAEPIPERSAQRIFKAADQILKAGTTDTAVSS